MDKADLLNNKLDTTFTNLLNELVNVKKTCTHLQNQVRLLQNLVEKKNKRTAKELMKYKIKGNRKPSGFAKPTIVTDELCKFMGRNSGTKIARTEVTQYIISYIKTNNLRDNDNRKIIVPDAPLKNLLGVEEDQEVTYFNIQKFMNKHFVKDEELLNT
jgi:chromatin remodeling complex protein RSC6